DPASLEPCPFRCGIFGARTGRTEGNDRHRSPDRQARRTHGGETSLSEFNVRRVQIAVAIALAESALGPPIVCCAFTEQGNVPVFRWPVEATPALGSGRPGTAGRRADRLSALACDKRSACQRRDSRRASPLAHQARLLCQPDRRRRTLSAVPHFLPGGGIAERDG